MYRTENISPIIVPSLVAGETTYPQNCSLSTAVVLSPIYTAVTWQWVYMSQYLSKILFSIISFRAAWCRSNALFLCLGGARFESRPGHRLFWLACFAVFPNSSQANASIVSRLDHSLILSNHFEFIIHPSFYRSTLCSLAADSLITHSWSRVLLEKPPIVQLLENFPAFYGTRRFITAFT
jgi:hypothetical protein